MLEKLVDKNTVIIFAYTPAGLGHLRVTNALLHGLPKEVSPILMQARDKTVSRVHHFMSSRRTLRRLMEWTQRGFVETMLTNILRSLLRNNTDVVEAQVETILEERAHTPARVILVATHFGLAHQLAESKPKIERKLGVDVMLFVYVTDDSPQKLWYIYGADGIFVPSHKTKNALLAYGKESHLPEVNISVFPYPLSPKLTKKLTVEEFEERLSQVHPLKSTKTHVCLPISGAAVGTQFYLNLVKKLRRKTNRFRFHLISKRSKTTSAFLNEMEKRKNVTLIAPSDSRDAIAQYNYLYRDTVLALEITKPSEQAFKSLIGPRYRGGVVLLFTEPVGRQEHDNLNFLMRHGLMPSYATHKTLWSQSLENISPREIESWRALLLPESSSRAAEFIDWCMRKGIILQMMRSTVSPGQIYRHKAEMGGAGVKQFWLKVARMIV